MAPQVTFEPVISEAARAYLHVQKGRLDSLAGDRAAWHAAYRKSILATYEAIAPFLPDRCERLLDVGSGLGGIDILLARHTGAEVFLLDGVALPPVVEMHRKPFNDMGVAAAFLAENGVPLAGYFTPALDLGLLRSGEVPLAASFDLVVSFGAWCFHFPPEEYLDFVLSRLRPGGRLIVEVRREKREWLERLNDAPLKIVGYAGDAVKYRRLVYERD